MLEEHSLWLVAASIGSVVVYVFGLIANFSSLAMHYTATPLIPDILRKAAGESSANTTTYVLPVSPADWSAPLWGVVFVCQCFWLVYALTGICRRTTPGPVYNNPKLLPVQVHVFFSLAVLTQVGWLVLMDRGQLAFALVLVLLSAGCSLVSLGASYRSLSTAQPILAQEERLLDLWAVRILAHNALALFVTWISLHGALTFALLLTFGFNEHVTTRTGSLVELCAAGFLVFVYVLSDLTIYDKYSRYVLLPYLGFVLFHSAQLNQDWTDMRSPVFVLLACVTSFTFACVFIKVVALLCRYVLERQKDSVVVITRPLAAEMEEETYLLQQK